MMHNYSPDSEVALEHMSKIDEWLGKIYDLDHEEIYITGGYGMNKNPPHPIFQIKKIRAMMYHANIIIQDSELEVSKIKTSGMVFLYLKRKF